MDFEGKVIQFLGEVTGTSKAGNPWKKKEWVVETFGPYPKKVKIQCFGDRSDNMLLEPGHDYVLSVDLESHEFNGRWYTDVSVFRAQEKTGQPNYGQQNQNFQNGPAQGGFSNPPYGNSNGGFGETTQTFTVSEVSESDEDLPF